MTILPAALSALLVGFLLYFVHGLDAWLGILAFKFQYLAICVVVAGTVALAWLPKSRRASLAAGLITLALLASPYVLPKPSSRILREALIDVPTGMSGDEVEKIVRNAYEGSGYVMPRITRDDHRIHVSLLTQAPGDCTAAIFHLADGLVVEDEFSAD